MTIKHPTTAQLCRHPRHPRRPTTTLRRRMLRWRRRRWRSSRRCPPPRGVRGKMHRWRKKPAVAGVVAGEVAAAGEAEAGAEGAAGAKLRLPMMYPRRMRGMSRTIRRRRLLLVLNRSRSARVSFTTRAKCTCTRLSGRARCTSTSPSSCTARISCTARSGTATRRASTEKAWTNFYCDPRLR